MNIILIGVQGSGKGTQAEFLSGKTGWKHINVGDIFRQHIEKNSELGRAAKNYMDQGFFVPDEFVLGMVKEALDETKNGFILDGFPRNVEQAEFLLNQFQIDSAIFLKLEDDVARERLTARRLCSVCKTDYNLLFKPPQKEEICDVCGGKLLIRDDDNEAAISKRIEKFHKKTEKVIDMFEKRGILKVVQANQSVEAINTEMLQSLGLEN